MEKIQLLPPVHGERLQQAREAFFNQRSLPDGLVSPHILRSWARCQQQGLQAQADLSRITRMEQASLRHEQARNAELLNLARPVMEHVFEQIADSGSMVILADAQGLLLETLGDPGFVGRAARVALSAGASWEESLRGTNAIGTALAEAVPTEVHGAEHFLSPNHFLACCASPIFSPAGMLLGVLDISGDYRGYHAHTLGLVRVASAMVEKRLFEARHPHELLLCFHPCPQYLGSLKEGMAAISAAGQILAINRQGLEILRQHRLNVQQRDFSLVFEAGLPDVLARLTNHAEPPVIRVGTQMLSLQIRNPAPLFKSFAGLPGPATRAPASPGCLPEPCPLDALNTGDVVLARAIHQAKRVLGKGIPLLIQGESGVGKEVFAQAFHASGTRHKGAFVALNCAAIPESLIESELFGYQGGAFTGARKEGAPGKIQQAHGGTLFLDEIGDMPLSLQARLLRVLQARQVTPLGSTQSIPVDISLVCATHRNLREAVAQGHFREDLYYRLNGLSLALPPLRARSDFHVLLARLLQEVAGGDASIRFSATALHRLAAYPWPGNIRQLGNTVRLAVALLDEGESVIPESNLPDEIREGLSETAAIRNNSGLPGLAAFPDPPARSLADQTRLNIMQALETCQGNVSAAARLLGISRNTLYRHLKSA